MKQEIKERVEKIRKGEVPEGYKKTKVGIIPVDWKFKKISNLFNIFAGGDLDLNVFSKKRDEDYKYPIYSNSLQNKGLYGWYKIQQFSGEKITVTARGSIGHSEYRNKDFSAFGRILILEPKHKFNLYTISEHINFSILIFNESTGVPQLTAPQFRTYSISIFSFKEQQQIAEILSTWDTAIELKEKLIEEKKEFKRGLMQKLLVGKLRFKEYVTNPNLQEVKRYSILPEEWDIKKASSIFSNISKKNNGNEQLLSATQNNGVIPRDMLDGDVMSPSGDTKSYKLVEDGDFVISLRSFQGGIEYSSYQGIISPAYTVLKNKIPVCKDFYRHLFKSRLFIDRLASSVIGIRDGKQISYGDFSFMLLPYPELKEQKKIASMLNSIDTGIDLLNKELNQLKEQKRGLMQLLLTGIIRVEVD